MDRTGSSGPRTLFQKGPNFTLDTFSHKDFIVRDFIESLVEEATPANRRSAPSVPQPTHFEPKPLIRTFENALSQLGTLRDDLEQSESELQSQVRRAEAQHDQTLDTLGSKLDETMRQFEELDLSLGSNGIATSYDSDGHTNDRQGSSRGGGRAGGGAGNNGNLAVQIGAQLEELDRKRRRAVDAAFIIQCWMEVSATGQLTSLEDLQHTGGTEARVRCAMIAQQLIRISQRLDPAVWGQTNGVRSHLDNGVANGGPNGVSGNSTRTHNTREIIEKFCEALEQDLLKQFNHNYKRQNFDDMRECAKVLHDFNGGSSVIAMFVNQHQFFIDRDQLIADEMATEGDIWEQLTDPDCEPPSIEPTLQSLVDEVKIVVQEESFMIKRAFPYYEVVLTKFIQRVFQQSIQQRLEMVLEKTASLSSLASLRSLHSARAYIGNLVEDLKAHGLTEHPEPCSGQISQVLDQQLEELFVPYLVSYIDREKRSLDEMNSSLLFKYTVYHSRRKKAPSGFMASLAQQTTQLVSSTKDAYLEHLESPELTATQRAMMMRLAGISPEQAMHQNTNDIEVTDEDGVIRVDTAKRMLRWMAESVRRTLELGSTSDTPKDVAVLLHLVLTSMGQVYIDTALDAALDSATSQESTRTEPDMSYLPMLRPALTITSIMSRFVTAVLIRLAEGNATVRRSMESQTRLCLGGIEKKVNSILKSTLDVVYHWINKSLAAQKKTDFRPKDTDELLGQTVTCKAICTYLARTRSLLGQSIDGHNLVMTSTELVRQTCTLLFEHFKRFNVNATGGLTVTQDIARYVTTLKEFTVAKDVEEMVEVLSEIGSLFIIGPEALKERSRNLAPGGAGIGGGSLGTNATGINGQWQICSTGKRLYKNDFRAFVSRRDDMGTAGIQSVLASLV